MSINVTLSITGYDCVRLVLGVGVSVDDDGAGWY